ncbi:MAG: hypothetical protein JNM68_01400, partial [Dinghuibacter sp.]|nr:hypothetical protein [Dinghuibacter sp.]
SKAYPGYDVTGEGGLRQVVKALGGLFHSFKEIFNGGFRLMMSENKCRYVALDKSFIRLTDPNLKKPGGGLRVKKVVINDNFDKMTRSDANTNDGMANATYGQEYFYTKKELVNGVLTEISSGVANWEPAMGADENPHRQALEFYNLTPKADYDYRVMEIPFAEMLYPSAMVGYSRVETRSIHRDTVKNAAGISVSEFYTSREFPTSSLYTPLSEYNAEDRYESGVLDKIMKTDLKTAVALTQGFKVDLNDMNGKLKKQSTYSPQNLNDPISYTENFYSMVKSGDNTYKLNHDFPVIAGSEGKVTQSVIGREVEVMTDFREHNQQTITTNINFNIDVINAVFVPIPIPTNWRPVVKESNIYRSASIMKVVNHYSILDSVVAVDKGSMVSTKNLVYDAETGEPLLTRTNNEQNKPIYNFSYPAHWAYSGMGLAYKNIDVEYRNLVFRHGKLDNANEAGVNYNYFESGDEIMVRSEDNAPPAPVAPCDGQSSLIKNSAKKIWAVYTGKTGSLTPQWLFLDADGNPYTANNVTMRIIRSGKRNMFATPVGSVTSLKSPVNAGNGQLTFNDNTEILQTSSAVFKDHWRVDDVFFKKDSLVTTTVQARVRRKDIFLTDNVTASMYQKTTYSPQYWSAKQTYALTSKRSKNGNFFNRSEKWLDRSFLLFDFAPAAIPANANLYKSFLSLYSHTHPYGGTNVHPGLHGNTVSQTTGIPGLINTMRGNWFAANDATNWGNTYMGSDNNVSTATTFIPNAQTGAENYSLYNNNWLDITGLVSANTGTPLGLTQKIGLQLKIFNDKHIDGGNLKHRCFWTSYFGKNFTSPFITYYYYECGDNTSYNNYYNDPYENTLINCYSYSVPATFCLSKFTQRKSINPYVEGIWGNWRTDSTFVYYGERKESSVTGSPVDLRKGGTIINYQNFWNFTASNAQYLGRNYNAANVWSWNSVITQYNRKGYEIENKDPLGRFNAGLYGYGQQLPIA